MNITVYLGANEGNDPCLRKAVERGGVDWKQWKRTSLWRFQIRSNGCDC